GCFLIQNIGPGPIHGALKGVSKEAKTKLVTTVAYKFGSNPVCYALEGSVAIAGAAITWLRDNLELIESYNEIESIAKGDQSAGGLFFVPAFQGLYAPYWDANATGTIIGISQFSRKCHLVRATLEGVAFQTNDILALMRQDNSGIKVDGGMSANNLLCQILSDISGAEIVRPKMTEATALGAAMVAGYHLGIWKIFKEPESDVGSESETEKPHINGYTNGSVPKSHRNGLIRAISRRLSQSSITRKLERSFSISREPKLYDKNYDVFHPNMSEQLRQDRINTWKAAVSLYAPYWDANATGTIIGISQFSRKCHLVRATLEGVAFQTNDILALMRQDNSGIKVDGGMSANNLLCQILSDISGAEIVRPKMTEATALGAAMVAGYHLGIWKIFKEPESDVGSESETEKPHINGYTNGSVPKSHRNGLIRAISRRLSQSSITRKLERSFSISREPKLYDKNYDVFHPNMSEQLRQDRINTWKAAVSRSRKWIRVEKQEQKRVDYKRLSSIPFMLYVLFSFGTHILSESMLKNSS
ncbi:unnamed protein product, partial [Oppiella nova]